MTNGLLAKKKFKTVQRNTLCSTYRTQKKVLLESTNIKNAKQN